jgi:hypothetical protein
MVHRKVTTFRIDDDLFDAMQRLWERDGISYSEQIRRSLRPWLEARDVLVVRSGAPTWRRRRIQGALSKPKRVAKKVGRR